MDLQAFLDMGGYARFVWPAYGLTGLVLLLNLLLPWLRERRLRRHPDAQRGRSA